MATYDPSVGFELEKIFPSESAGSAYVRADKEFFADVPIPFSVVLNQVDFNDPESLALVDSVSTFLS